MRYTGDWTWAQYRTKDGAVCNWDAELMPHGWSQQVEYKRMSHTFVVGYPTKLYPAREALPVRSVEIPIWPDLKG